MQYITVISRNSVVFGELRIGQAQWARFERGATRVGISNIMAICRAAKTNQTLGFRALDISRCRRPGRIVCISSGIIGCWGNARLTRPVFFYLLLLRATSREVRTLFFPAGRAAFGRLSLADESSLARRGIFRDVVQTGRYPYPIIGLRSFHVWRSD